MQDLTIMSKFKRDRYLEKVRKGVHIFQKPDDGTYLGTLDPESNQGFPLFKTEQEAIDYGVGNNKTLKITLRSDRTQTFWFAYQ